MREYIVLAKNAANDKEIMIKNHQKTIPSPKKKEKKISSLLFISDDNISS